MFLFIFLATHYHVSQSGKDPIRPAVEAQSPYHWTARELPEFYNF